MDFVAGEKHFLYGTTEYSRINRLRKRITANPDGVQIIADNELDGLVVRLPCSAWTFEPKPKAKRAPMSEEQLAAAKERLASARKSKSCT